MIIFLILLLIALVLIGVFAAQNGTTEQITFLAYQWKDVPQWLAPVIAGGVIAVLFLLYILYAGARHGLSRRGLRRHLGEHERTISGLQEENTRLKEDLAHLRGRESERGPVAPTDG